jgi:hypothetical protein
MPQSRRTAAEQAQVDPLVQTTPARRLRARCQAVCMGESGPAASEPCPSWRGAASARAAVAPALSRTRGGEGYRVTGLQGNRSAVPRRGRRRCRPGCKRGLRVGRASARLGPLPSGRPTWSGPRGARASGPPGGASGSALASAPRERRSAVGAAPRRSSREHQRALAAGGAPLRPVVPWCHRYTPCQGGKASGPGGEGGEEGAGREVGGAAWGERPPDHARAGAARAPPRQDRAPHPAGSRPACGPRSSSASSPPPGRAERECRTAWRALRTCS